MIQRMILYGAGAGALLGLLYFSAAAVVALLVGGGMNWGLFIAVAEVGLLISFVGGMTTGLIDGLVVAAFVNFARRFFNELSRYRHIMTAISSTLAAIITFFVLSTLLPVRESVLNWQVITFVVSIVLPVFMAGAAAWWATVRVLRWVQDQIRGA